MYRGRLVKLVHIIFFFHSRGTVVANQGVGQTEYLSPVRRVGKAFGVTGHCRVKNHLPGRRYTFAKRLSPVHCSVLQAKFYIRDFCHAVRNYYLLLSRSYPGLFPILKWGRQDSFSYILHHRDQTLILHSSRYLLCL